MLGDESVWRASTSIGKLVGFLLALLFPALAVVSFWRFRAVDGAASWLALGAAVVCAAAGAGVIYLLRGLATIRYTIGNDRLTITWMGQQRVIRFEDIREVVYDPRGGVTGRGYEPVWPGYHVSTMQMRDGAWQSVATQAPRRRVRIKTRTGIYAISPQRPILFLGELARRRQAIQSGQAGMRQAAPPSAPIAPPVWNPPVAAPYRPPTAEQLDRPVMHVRPETREPQVAQPPGGARGSVAPPRTTAGQREPRSVVGWATFYVDLFRDRLLGDPVSSRLLAVGVMLPLLMAAFLYSQYEGISSIVPLHWNAHGDVDAVGTRRDLWRFPLMAVVILALNATLATVAQVVDRFMARMLLAATPAAQAVAFVALIRAVI